MSGRSFLGRLLGAFRGPPPAGEPRFTVAPPGPNEGRFPFVYVEDDGSARELDAEERAYLREPFHPADGGRPYVKGRYGDRTPDGRLRGFLRRDELPANIRVRPVGSSDAPGSP